MIGLALTAWFATLSPAPAAELAIEHERYQLDNGLDVVLAPDDSAPIVHVQLWYHVGSKDEKPGLTGFAHLFEHLMFNGSLNAPGDYFEPLQTVGGRINGTTNTERTNYFETVPARYLPLALFMESDRMGHLLEVLDETKLANQQDVVRNERRQRYENPPYGDVWVYLANEFYPKGHPYHHTTIGSHEDLQNATLDDVKQFFRTWYGPNNATLVIVGDFDTEATKALVEENFGWIAPIPEPPVTTAEPVVLPEDKEVRVYEDVPERRLWLAYPSPPLYAPGDAELDILTNVLCSGADSRMNQRLVREEKVARSIGCYQASSGLGSRFVISGTAAPGHTTDEMIALIDEEVAKVLGEAPPTAEDVATAITQYEVGFYRRIQSISGRAGAMSSYLNYQDTPDWLAEDLNRYTSLTAEQVVAASAPVLSANRLELHYLPAADDPDADADTPTPEEAE